MKVLVLEIDKNSLLSIYRDYISSCEITFLSDATKEDLNSIELQNYICEERINSNKIAPYWINENIEDLENLMQLCIYKSQRGLYTNTFSDFSDLILSIYKQREIGYKISDIRYVYEKCKNKYPLDFVDSSNLKGWEAGWKVIVGESKLGKMYLSQDGDFVFGIEYQIKGLFGKIKTKNTHWHPQYFTEAIKDLEDFMNNSLEIRI